MQGICVARPVALTATLGYSVLISEWCGKSLDTMSPQELTALGATSSCMECVRQIHSAGVVHGDLALRNIAYKESVFTFLDWETSKPYNEVEGRSERKDLQTEFPKMRRTHKQPQHPNCGQGLSS